MYLSVSVLLNVIAAGMFVYLQVHGQLLERVLARMDTDLPLRREYRHSYLDYFPVDGLLAKVHGLANVDYNSLIYDRLGGFPWQFRSDLRKIARKTSGIRVRFKTNSSSIHFALTGLQPASFSYPGLSETASSGADLYVDSRYWKTITASNVRDVIDISGPGIKRSFRNITFYFPLYSTASLKVIGVDRGSKVSPLPDYARSIVFYGTSITQGADADRPAHTYPALLAKRLGVDFFNFGFSGNGRGDTEVARALSRLDADVYVLKYGRQADDSRGVKGNLIAFCKKLKLENPDTNIVIVSPIYDAAENWGGLDLRNRREAFRAGYLELTRRYTGISFVDGLTLLGPEDGDALSDGTHPNAQGHFLIADRLYPTLRKVIYGIKSEGSAESGKLKCSTNLDERSSSPNSRATQESRGCISSVNSASVQPARNGS